MPEEEEIIKELITYKDWLSTALLFLGGLVVVVLKSIRGGEKFRFWLYLSSGILGGMVSVGIGHGLLWFFPSMNVVTAWGISSTLMILLSDKDMREYIMSKKVQK